MILVFECEAASKVCKVASGRSATQPAVGANPARATWMKTALPRPATRGRVLWSISMMRS